MSTYAFPPRLRLPDTYIDDDSATSTLQNTTEAGLPATLIKSAPSSTSLHRHLDKTSIEDLPVELLSTFLELVSQTIPLASRYQTLCGLRLVSRRWAKVITHTTSLWCRIDLGCRKEKVEKLFQLSGQRPLELDYVNTGSALALPSIDFAHRLKSASLSGVIDCQPLYDLLRGPAPHLETFLLGGLGPLPANLFGGHTPRLTTFGLSGAPIPWGSAILSGLRTLALRSMGAGGSDALLSSHRILEVLGNCPSLEALVLKYDSRLAAVPETLPSLPANTPPVYLPFLVNIDISLPAYDCAFLPFIHAPNVEAVSIEQPVPPSDNWKRGFTDVQTAFAPFLPALKCRVKANVRTSLVLASHLIAFHSATPFPQANFHVDLHDAGGHLGADDTFAWFVTHFNKPLLDHGVPMSWNLGPTAALGEAECEAFRWAFPTTTVLSLSEDANYVLETLSGHRMMEKVAHWPMPNLRILVVRGQIEDLSEVDLLVRSRYGAGWTLPGQEMVLPRAFDLLEFDSLPKDLAYFMVHRVGVRKLAVRTLTDESYFGSDVHKELMKELEDSR